MKAERKTNPNTTFDYTFIDNQADKVCFMFSGAGYTYDKPLFYYSTMVMLESEYDVVHIHYAYEKDVRNLPLENLTKIIVNDVNPIIEEVHSNKDYKEKVLLGKSFGTLPIIDGFMKDAKRFHDSKIVILTPLLTKEPLYETLLTCNHDVYLVIGTKDQFYRIDKINALSKKENMTLKVIEDANHSLDIIPFHTEEAVEVMKETMAGMKNFIKTKVIENTGGKYESSRDGESSRF
ncbi:alpha/beta family hydrolase [Pseudalkalibacillus berkeleyi]|uniref:Alpha/beta hydrolase n=1 Tax=Pseudalkalibacillus berkeleyi TaxID=1069813 RepID=A0ABS9GXS4_9BACL|nr:alpha/beta family hydrolase [Pseudalkalibacillus berkeleyi]MCF6136415.1 alpha/beta hydrolase [Pseudalkalibacillus berkeleyi]